MIGHRDTLTSGVGPVNSCRWICQQRRRAINRFYLFLLMGPLCRSPLSNLHFNFCHLNIRWDHVHLLNCCGVYVKDDWNNKRCADRFPLVKGFEGDFDLVTHSQ